MSLGGSMSAGSRAAARLGVDAGLTASLRVDQRIAATAAATGEDEDRSAPLPAGELEPPSLEDLGDSDRHDRRYRDVENCFDLIADQGPLPWMRRLPGLFRPAVRYEIMGSDFIARPTHEQSSHWYTVVRMLIAEAVTLHVRRAAVKLTSVGDWVHLPCIHGDRELAELMVEVFNQSSTKESITDLLSCGRDGVRRRLDAILEDYGWLKDFAIRLPNGDVIRVQTILRPAFRSAKRPQLATCGGALRVAADASAGRPSTVAHEAWSSEDWAKFNGNQQARGANASRQTGT